MNLDRRQFIGASLAASAALLTGSARAMPVPKHTLPAAPMAAAKPRFLPEALAALDRHGLRIAQRDRLAIADYSLHSGELRLAMVDVAAGAVTGSYLVAHGRGSDPANTGYVQLFSNRPGSNASSDGSFLTGEEYYGKHGRSRRLHGLDEDNDLAFDRAIVIHSASYVDRAMAREEGRVGRSFGCFTVEQRVLDEVLETLGPGHLLFAAK